MFASLFQSCCGEGGALQADVAVCGELSLCSGQAACSFGGLSPDAVRLFPPQRASRMARGLRAFYPGAAYLFPPRRAARAARGLVPSPWAHPRLFPPWRAARAARGLPRPLPPRPQRAPPVGSQEVFRQEQGSVCSVGGGGFSGAEFTLYPPAASYLQWGWGSSSLEFLSPFVL